MLEVAVTGVPDDVYGQAVVAHLVLRDGGAITPGALRAWCASRLAPFQVPKRFIVRDELPRNPTGKVLKRTLRARA